MADQETWIFGYASLIWKPGFDHDRKIVGFVKDRRRAFHLACYEHRGTWSHPARVATLEEEEDSVCWGVALCIKGSEAVDKAMSYLHMRESEYDTVECLEFFTEESPDVPVISNVKVFTSSLTSIYYLGPTSSKEDVARQIATATGPCGHNYDYLFRLVEALREIGHEDEEVLELATMVRRELSLLQQANVHQNNVNTANQVDLRGSQSIYNTTSLLIPPTMLAVPLNQSPRLLKSQAR